MILIDNIEKSSLSKKEKNSQKLELEKKALELTRINNDLTVQVKQLEADLNSRNIKKGKGRRRKGLGIKYMQYNPNRNDVFKIKMPLYDLSHFENKTKEKPLKSKY